MAVADIAALDKRYAICLATGARPTVLELMPWYREPDAAGHLHADITAAAAQASADVRRTAIAPLGTNNPLARRLHTHNPDQHDEESP